MSSENAMLEPNLDTGLVNSYDTGESSSSSLWMWALVFGIIGVFSLVGYYYLLYFYDATSISDAISIAITRSNLKTAEEKDWEEKAWKEKYGVTGDVERYDDDDDAGDLTFKKVLLKALDNAATEGFSSYDEDLATGTIQKMGSLNWGFIEDDGGCMSGDIFPTRDICINPKLRAQ